MNANTNKESEAAAFAARKPIKGENQMKKKHCIHDDCEYCSRYNSCNLTADDVCGYAVV